MNEREILLEFLGAFDRLREDNTKCAMGAGDTYVLDGPSFRLVCGAANRAYRAVHEGAVMPRPASRASHDTAAERERCAKIAEDAVDRWRIAAHGPDGDVACWSAADVANACADVARLIREG